eukprot:3827396-Lingulodinium_polyedra.AAC.1
MPVDGNAWRVTHEEAKSGAVNGFADHGSSMRLLLLRRAMEAQQAAMQQLISVSSEKWSTIQNARELQGERRLFQVCEARRIAFDAVNYLAQQFRSAEPWALIPDQCRNTDLGGLVFRLLSRSGGALHQLVWMPVHGYPTKLFMLLTEPGLAAQIAQDYANHPCTMDSYTRAFCASFPTAQALTSERAMAELYAGGILPEISTL